MSTCLVCQSDRVKTVLDLGRQPVASHFAAAAQAKGVEHALALAVCHACGTVQLARPFPAAALVSPHGWMTYREPESHLDAVTTRILGLDGVNTNAAIAGLTFKDQSTLERFRAHDFSRVWSIDPGQDLDAPANAGVESIQALLTPERARAIVERHGPADLLVVRHIVEHAEKPWQFMAALGDLLAQDGYLVIEVPDCRGNLERLDYTMIWEEHALYFTPETLPQVLAAAGCGAVAVEVHPFAFEDVIVLYARKTSADAPHLKTEPTVAARNAGLAEEYGAAFGSWTDRYRRLFDGWTKNGKRLAAYGAGHLTCAFINFHGLADYFAFVVDDTPHKQGLYLPKCGLPIVSRSHLAASAIDRVLFGLAPEIEPKVIANNPEFVARGGQFYSMLVDSPRSIRNLIDADRASGVTRRKS